MATKQEIRELIASIGKRPELVDRLISNPNEDERKKLLEENGLVKPGEKGPTEEEIRQEIIELLPSEEREAAGERAVEWVAAIATAAAGAMAAACTAE
jgi:hypothetical protein